MSTAALAVDKVSKFFGDFPALRNVSFEVADINDLRLETSFDAIVGRILMAIGVLGGKARNSVTRIDSKPAVTGDPGCIGSSRVLRQLSW